MAEHATLSSTAGELRLLFDARCAAAYVRIGSINVSGTLIVNLIPTRSLLVPPASASCSPGLLSGVRLLIVDDAEEVLDAVTTLCEMEGATVATAATPSDALRQLAQHDFDLLVSDIGLPEMDGYALLATIRRGERNANIPALALTGYSTARGRNSLFTDELSKPVPMADLLITLQTMSKALVPA